MAKSAASQRWIMEISLAGLPEALAACARRTSPQPIRPKGPYRSDPDESASVKHLALLVRQFEIELCARDLGRDLAVRRRFVPPWFCIGSQRMTASTRYAVVFAT